MTADEALTRLQSMLAWDSDPELTEAEVTSLLSMSALTDPYGLAPSDASWTPTYDLKRGAAEGWRWKAARATPRTAVGADGSSIERQQVYDHCMRMIEQYSSKTKGTIRIPGYGSLVTGTSAVEPNAT